MELDPGKGTAYVMSPSRGRRRTACGVCKAQKVRCSGERPRCRRCVRLTRECIYDEEPAAVRRISRARSHPAPAPPSTSAPGTEDANSSGNVGFSGADEVTYAQTQSRNSLVAELGIPQRLMLTLTEVYFDNVYQSRLLLHKKRFSTSIKMRTAKPHVVLGVCALGAKFYLDEAGEPTLKNNGSMVGWAKRAGKLVFQEAEDLHEENIVTFCNLALFWHSEGAWKISHLYKGNASQLLYIGSSKESQSDDSLSSELRCRRFWACYLMQCYSAEGLSAFGNVQNFSLPWPDEGFEEGICKCRRTFMASDERNGGIFGELIRGMTLWSSVVSSVKSADKSMSTRIAAIHTLDDKITKWWQNTPSKFKLTSNNINGVPLPALPKTLLANIIYHQSLCALHSSIVPLFCWGPDDETWASARQISAQVAFEHACTVSALIQAVLETHPCLGTIPSFIPYAAYCGCAIQIPFMWSSSPIVKQRARRNVEANIKLIHGMSKYWTLTSLLRIHVRCLYMVHRDRSTILEGEPKDIDPSKLTSFRINATHARTSILEFTGILRSNQGGYVEQGEETTNLGIENQVHQSEIQHEMPASFWRQPIGHSSNSRPIQFELSSTFPTPESFQSPFPLVGNMFSQAGLVHQTQASPLEQMHQPNYETAFSQSSAPPSMQAEEIPDLDVFNLFFDSELLSLLPEGELLNASQYDSELFNLDYL